MKRVLARAAGAGLALAVASGAALAQPLPPPPGGQGAGQYQGGQYQGGQGGYQGAQSTGRNPVCVRLEGQLASLDRSAPQDGGRGEQIRRYEESANRQQAELDRANAQFQRMGCEGGGFFIFRSAQNPQCDPLQGQIRQMRSNLDQMLQSLQRMQGGAPGSAADEQRRSILSALGQYDCGPQYRQAAAPRPRGWFDSMFGSPESSGAPIDVGELPQTGNYRTVCVRTCDGYFFPISYSANQSKFPEDERTCQRMCPASEAMLFTHRNPGEEVKQAVSLTGTPYMQLPNAFRYRTEINPSCTCKRAGESWAETMKGVEDQTLQRGDIVVTDETARQLSQPKPERPAQRQEPNRARQPAARQPAATPPAQSAPPPAAEAPAPPTTPAAPRSVGTQFYR